MVATSLPYPTGTRQGRVLDGILGILAPSSIGEVVKHRVERVDECIKVEQARHTASHFVSDASHPTPHTGASQGQSHNENC